MTLTEKTERSQTDSISFEFDLHHLPEKVWRALTDPALLELSSIVLPQIAQLFTKLSPLGLPKNIIDIYEAKALILKAKESKTINECF